MEGHGLRQSVWVLFLRPWGVNGKPATVMPVRRFIHCGLGRCGGQAAPSAEPESMSFPALPGEPDPV